MPTIKRIELPQLLRENPHGTPHLPERMVWTSSSLRLFRKCKRKFFWKYICGLRPRNKAGSLIIGHAFHAAIGEWYAKPKMDMEAIVAKHAVAAREEAAVSAEFYDQEEAEKLEVTLNTFSGMMLGYARIHGADRKDWKVLHVEKQFSIDLGDFVFQGKVDLIAEPRVPKRGASKCFIAEHKTAKKIGESYIDRLPLDTQCRAYIFGAQRGLGLKPDELLYDVVRKCQLRRKSGETADAFNERICLDYEARPDFYFYREPLKFSQADVAAFELEMRQTHAEYVAIADGPAPFDPRSWTPNDSTCNEFFRTCEYMQLCTTGLDKGTAGMFTKNETMHEELEEEV